MSKMPSTRKDQPTITATMKIVMCGQTKPTMPAPIQITPKTISGQRWRGRAQAADELEAVRRR